jgi:hypothetical protein
MGIATDILALRVQHLSSVTRLHADLEQLRNAQVSESPLEKISARVFYVGETCSAPLKTRQSGSPNLVQP